MLTPPPSSEMAQFKPGFGQRVLLTVDTEEEFDWNADFSRDRHSLSHTSALPRFQAFCESIGAHPVYLVDWPIANDARAIEVIGDAIGRGSADVGVQLHPWVNPPFDEALGLKNSYAGNLPRELEAAKFAQLRDRIETNFETAPLIYRAGRYGLGPNSADILKANGIKIDTSVRPLFDYSDQHGPDYSHHPATPYWVDAQRSLLETPMTSVHWGPMRGLGKPLQKAGSQFGPLLSMLSRLGLMERIALTPEGVTAKEAIRGIDQALDDGLSLLVLSFHSPSLAPGLTPYTRTDGEVESLYDWFGQVYAHFGQRGVKTATVGELIEAARR